MLKTKDLKKILGILLVILILASTLKFLIFKPQLAFADSTLGFNEGYGTIIKDNNGNISGTITNAVWKTEDLCKFGKCLYFDGTGDLINFGDDADLDHVAADNFTIEGWFRTPNITSGQRTIVAKHNASAGGYKIYIDSNGYLVFGIDDDSAWTPDDFASTTATAFDDNKWHFFSAVKTGTTSITIYVDGIQYQVDNTIDSAGTLANADNFYIGIDGDGSSNGYSGFLDEIKFYNTARTSTDILTDITGTDASRGMAASFSPDQSYLSNGLLGYWKLNETSGNAIDSSGNSTTLTNGGTTTFTSGKFGKGSEHVPASSQYFSTATQINSMKSISFWANPDTTTNYFANLTSSAYITASSGTVSVTGFANPKIYINEIETSTIVADSWQLITVTTDTSINADQLYIGRQGSNYYDGTIDEVRIYNKTLLPNEVSKLYNWAPGPVGWWKMDENTGSSTINDNSGNGNVGTMEGSMTNDDWKTGKYGSSLDFDGSNDRIYNATPTWDFTGNPTKSFTVGYWLKPDICDSTVRGISLGDGNGLRVATYTDDLMIQIIAGGTLSYANGACVVGRWTHVEGMYDSLATRMYIYVNGVLIDTDIPASTDTSSQGDWLSIGSAQYLGYFDGQIDDVKIYDYVRTTKQVIEDMNGGHPAPGSPVGSSLIHYKFDEGYGTTANNNGNAGSNKSGTITSGTWTNSGKFDKALTFTASTSVTATITDPIYNNTVSLWVYPTTSIASKTLITATKLITDSSSRPTYGSCVGTTIPLSTWTHITAVSNGSGSCTIYQNGVQTSTGTTGVSFGTSVNIGGSSYIGSIDEFKFFNTSLDSSEVKVLYNQNSGQSLGATTSATDSYCPPGQSTTCTSPIAHWKLDENLGANANDLSTNENTLNGLKSGSPATIAVQQTVTGSVGDTGGNTVTLTSWTPGADELILLSVSMRRTSITPTASGNGITFTQIADVTNVQDQGRVVLFRGMSNSPTTGSITVTATGNDYAVMAVATRFSGIDTSGTNGSGSIETSNTSAGPATDNNDLLLSSTTSTPNAWAFASAFHRAETLANPPDTGETTISLNNLAGTTVSGNGIRSSTWYESVPSPTTVNLGVLNDLSAAGDWAIITVSIKPSITNINIIDWISGKYGSGASFSGNNQHVTRVDDSDFDFADDESATWETWFKHGTASAQEVILSKYNEAGYKIIMESDGDITCGLDYDSTWSPTDSATSTAANYDDGNWHHIACVKDGASSLGLYIDGILIVTDSTLTATNTLTNSDPIYFGVDADATSNDFTGKLDDIRIYRYKRTPAQIAWDMNKGAPVAHWKMDENTGTTANDSSGFGNTGTLTNTPTWTIGKFNFATSFTGSNQHITKADPTNSSLDFVASEPFTISTWFKHDTASAIQTLVSKMVTSDNDGGYKLKMESDGDITCETDDDDADTTIDDTISTTVATYDDNTWHHVACVYDTANTDLHIYIDGVLIATNTSTTTNSLANDDALFISIDAATGTEDWVGQIDDTRIYRYPLTAQQIKTVMNNSSAVKY